MSYPGQHAGLAQRRTTRAASDATGTLTVAKTADDARTIVGSSREVQSLRLMLSRVAGSAATVLVHGESGTGKELVAQTVHKLSSRSGAFVALNCAAIPRDLLESELFGHAKGAFSGAIADRKGRFELAHGGTLFLDEIGDMSLDMQAKLLRVLQERVVDPIGAHRSIPVDVRVVAATHRDLEAECAAGRFREDLYYRLNVLPVNVPPLRERAGDVAELAECFARRHATPGVDPISFAPDFMSVLMQYDWPGNIRELSNLIFRFSVLFPGQRLTPAVVPPETLPRRMRELVPQAPAVETAAAQPAYDDPSQPPVTEALVRLVADNPAPLRSVPRNPVEEIIMIAQGQAAFPACGVKLKQHLADVEQGLIRHALNHTGGNISRTAQLLHLQRTTLIQKLNKFKAAGDGGFDESDASLSGSGG